MSSFIALWENNSVNSTLKTIVFTVVLSLFQYEHSMYLKPVNMWKGFGTFFGHGFWGERMLPIYFYVSTLIWKESRALMCFRQPLHNPEPQEGNSPKSLVIVFDAASHRLCCWTESFHKCTPSSVLRQSPTVSDTKMWALCVCVWDWARPKQITQTKEESRRHQMNGVFLFTLYKRQTDGLTELEVCWIFVILKCWYCMLKERLSDGSVMKVIQ